MLATVFSLLAGGTALAQSAPAPAPGETYTQISLSPLPIRALGDLYMAPPAGAVTLAATPFSTGTWVMVGPGQTAVLAFPAQRADQVHLLLNSFDYTPWIATPNLVIGHVRFVFSDGTFADTTLQTGLNIREFRLAAGPRVVTTTSPTVQNGWMGQAQGAWGGGAAAIDMLTLVVQRPGALLARVEVADTLFGTPEAMIFSGLTLGTRAPAAADDEDDQDDQDADSGGHHHHGHGPEHHDVAPAAEPSELERKTESESGSESH